MPMCPLCGKAMQAKVTFKQGERVEAILVCDGPHDTKAERPDPRVAPRPRGKARESKPL